MLAVRREEIETMTSKVTKNPPDYILIALCDGLGGSSPKENFTRENFGDLLFRFHCLW